MQRRRKITTIGSTVLVDKKLPGLYKVLNRDKLLMYFIVKITINGEKFNSLNFDVSRLGVDAAYSEAYQYLTTAINESRYDNSTGYFGVSVNKSGNTFRVISKYNGKSMLYNVMDYGYKDALNKALDDNFADGYVPIYKRDLTRGHAYMFARMSYSDFVSIAVKDFDPFEYEDKLIHRLILSSQLWVNVYGNVAAMNSQGGLTLLKGVDVESGDLVFSDIFNTGDCDGERFLGDYLYLKVDPKMVAKIVYNESYISIKYHTDVVFDLDINRTKFGE